MSISLTSVITCVHIGQETPRYVPYARNHRGYLVQRLYRGVGIPYYTSQFTHTVRGGYLLKNYLSYEAYWQPFLNPMAVQQAGFEQAEVMRWADEHPNDIFSHATFAALCVRWDANPHGLVVHALDSSQATDLNSSVYFTPHTCWETGTTYFQLASYLPSSDPVELALLEQADLTDHQRENGAEGRWSGWYITDRSTAEAVLTSLGFSFALDQRQVLHYAGVYTAIGEEESLTYYATPEEAKAHVSLLPGAYVQPESARYPLATFGIVELLAGEQVVVAMNGEKVLDAAQYDGVCVYHRGRVQEHVRRNAPISAYHISDTEIPLPTIVPTLGLLLEAAEIPQRYLAETLGQTEEALNQWQLDPGQLTMRELQQVAALLKVDLPKLVTMLYDELACRDEAFPKG